MEPDLIPAFMMALGFAGMAILALKLLGSTATLRRKLMAAELHAVQLENENRTLRYQIEKDRNMDRASRGDYGTVYEGSYKEIYQSKKTGQWFASRVVTVDP